MATENTKLLTSEKEMGPMEIEDIDVTPVKDQSGINSLLTSQIEENERASNFEISILLLKGMIGLGIFILPHTTKFVGIWGFTVMYPIIFFGMSSYLAMIVYVSNQVGYRGKR